MKSPNDRVAELLLIREEMRKTLKSINALIKDLTLESASAVIEGEDAWRKIFGLPPRDEE